MTQQSNNYNIYDMYTLSGKSYLTEKGLKVFSKEATRWDIIRVYHWMHQYQPEATLLNSGDLFSGPKFLGDGSIDNIFKFTISRNYQCIFEQVNTTEANLKQMRKDVKLYDFTWFKTNTGDYFFACWNEKKIKPLSMYWTKEGMNALKTKQRNYELMMRKRHLYTHREIYSYCHIPVCKLYWP